MGMSFFPSRQISLYMAKLFLVRTLAVLRDWRLPAWRASASRD